MTAVTGWQPDELTPPRSDHIVDLLHPNPVPRRFQLIRNEDRTGISGTGVVATGTEYADGVVTLHWNTRINSTTVFQSMEDLEHLHGHNGASVIRWLD